MKSIIVLSILILVVSANADTEVEGQVEGRWALEGSPYIATGDIEVNRNDELIIEPGVEVLLEEGCCFQIMGRLIAEGNEEDSIFFDRRRGLDLWNGLRLINADEESIIRYCVFQHSERTGDWQDVESRGGALYLEDTNIEVSHCRFSSNRTTGEGGALNAFNCNPEIIDNEFTENHSDLNAACICLRESDAHVARNIMASNTTFHGPCGIITWFGDPVIEHNTIFNNVCDDQIGNIDWGCAIYVADGASPIVRYNLIYNNVGGAIFAGPRIHMENFYNNTIVNNEGRCAILFYLNCEITLTNNIVWDHNDPVWVASGGAATINYCNIQGDRSDGINIGEGVIDDDPLFVDEDNDDYNLTPNSPCRDTGDPDFPPDPDGSRSDMGCFPFGSAFELVVEPSELDFGPVVIEREINTELQVTLETDNEEFEPLEIRFQVDEGNDWLSVDPAEDVIEPNDTLLFDVEVFIPEGFDLGDAHGEIDLFVNDQRNPYLEIPVSTFVIEGWGSLSGSVIDAADEQPLADVEVNLPNTQYSTITDEEGIYSFDMLPAWRYSVCIDCEGFHPYRSEEFNIQPDQDVVLDIELVYGACQVDRQRIDVSLPPDEEQIEQFSIRSTGSGDLNYTVNCQFGGGDVDPWVRRSLFNAADQCGDDRLQGVEFVNGRFYVSGGNDGDGRGQVHIFDEDGEFIESFDQFVDSPWGIRDLAWNGNLLWGADGGRMYGFTTDGEQRESFDGPINPEDGENRALAWDDENGCLWICDIATDIIGIDLQGNIIDRIIRDDDLHIYGLSCYPEGEDGYTLYAFSKDGDYDCQVTAFNPDGGEPRFVSDLESVEELKAGGAAITSGWDPMSWVMTGILQGRRDVVDHVGIWQISTRSLWMTVDNVEGTIAPGDRDVVTVTLDSGGFPDNCELEAAIVIEHDGRGDAVEIPVILTVERDADPNRRLVPLLEGWNLISTNVEPENNDIVDIFNELVDQDLIVLVKNYCGRFYLPSMNYNDIPEWDVSQGYFVKTTQSTRLEVSGNPVEPNRPIDLPVGWSMVSYYPRLNVDPVIGFGGIVDRLIIAKDGMGRFYMPEHHFNDIPFLCEGQGYQVKLSDVAQLVWRLDDDEVLCDTAPIPSHFSPPSPTGCNMSLLLECAGLKPGDEIGVFGSTGLLVGCGVVDERNRCGLAVWGDDPTTEPVDGLKDDEAFELRAWNGEREINLDVTVVEGSLEYSRDGFAHGLINSSVSTIPVVLELDPPYPNPFNDWTRVSFNLPEAGQVELALYDTSGRLVRMLISERFEAGRYSTSLHAGNIPNGVYIIHLKTETGLAFRKALLMK